MTGYFSAVTLALAARGIDELIRTGGRMRLIVGCTLAPEESDAMRAGYAYRSDPEGYLESEVAKCLSHIALEPPTNDARYCSLRLGPLAWLTARPALFDDHPESMGFFTPGGPLLGLINEGHGDGERPTDFASFHDLTAHVWAGRSGER